MNNYTRLLSKLQTVTDSTADQEAIRLSNCYILICEIFPELENSLDAVRLADAVVKSMFKD
jgi:uncharacterized protein YqfB (UPF0267 family)